MAFKKMKQNLGFADLALKNSLKHNCSLEIHPVEFRFANPPKTGFNRMK